jgi:DUF1680 family protein
LVSLSRTAEINDIIVNKTATTVILLVAARMPWEDAINIGMTMPTITPAIRLPNWNEKPDPEYL